MSNHTPPHADPAAIAEAKKMWADVTRAGTIAIISITALLALMALTLV